MWIWQPGGVREGFAIEGEVKGAQILMGFGEN